MFKIIAAGILALPCVVVIICVVPIVAILSIPALLLLIFRPAASSSLSSSSSNVHPDQVIIVGGSSGIGLGIAKECVRRKVPKITLLARDRAKLEQAQTELQELARTTTTTSSTTSSQIHIVSVSVTDYPALEQAAANLQIPTTDHVVMWNCAGFAYPGEFLQVPVEKIFQQVETNQLGTLYLVRAFLPWLNQGCIVLTSSAAGQIGVYGLSTYAPTKYAIRGFAETLHAELIRSHPRLSIQMAFPVDTDTPGYQEELKTTPELTRLVVQAASEVATADQTAKSMVNAAFCHQPKFQVYFTLEGWMLSNLTSGMSPVTNLVDAMTQVALSGLFRIVGLFVLNDWWAIIRNYPAPAATTATTTDTKPSTKMD